MKGALERLTELDTLAKREEFRWAGLTMSAHAAGEDVPAEARRTAFLVAAALIGKAKAARSLATAEPPGPAPALPFPIPAWTLPKAVDAEFTLARVKHQPAPPPYPLAAKAMEVQGTVVVSVTVDPEGRPVRAVAESGPQELKAAALQYALLWRFHPLVSGEASQWARYRIPFPFKLAQGRQSPNPSEGPKRR